MAFIIKCDPIALQPGQRIILAAKAYARASPTSGDDLYIWLSESAGGMGLAAAGRIEAVSAEDPIDLAVQITRATPTARFGVADLKAHRDLDDGSPIAGLARKLYRHSLNKVAELEAQEETFLAGRWFEPPSSPRKYAPLAAWLLAQPTEEHILGFAAIEQILGTSLPDSASRPQWWANTTKAHTNVQREAWRAADYDAFLMKDQASVRFVKASAQPGSR